MKTFNQKHQYTPWNKMGSILSTASLFATLVLGATYCSEGKFFGSNTLDGSVRPIGVPISLTYKAPQALNLEGSDSSDLGLVTTATALKVKVSGCASGYTLSSATSITSVVNLYKSDKNCLVKLVEFTIGSIPYGITSTYSGGTDFSSWAPGQVGTFSKCQTNSPTYTNCENTSTGVAQAGDLIKVFVLHQVTAGGVTTSDTIDYNFTDIAAGATNNISQANVSTAVPLSATGQAAPSVAVAFARYLYTNNDGSGSLSFTINCTSALNPTSGSTAACVGDTIETRLDWLFIHDNYSQGAITVAQANQAFSDNASLIHAAVAGTQTGSQGKIIAVGGQDSYSNTIANGGWYTSETAPEITGSVPIYPSNLNNVLFIRRKDASGNTLSYLYFYVNIASITQSLR